MRSQHARSNFVHGASKLGEIDRSAAFSENGPRIAAAVASKHRVSEHRVSELSWAEWIQYVARNREHSRHSPGADIARGDLSAQTDTL